MIVLRASRSGVGGDGGQAGHAPGRQSVMGERRRHCRERREQRCFEAIAAIPRTWC